MHEAAAQEAAIISALRRIVRASDLHSRLLLHRYGLTTPQLAALREIARRDGVAASPLAQALHVGQATLTGILQRLEQRGLVSRQRAERDRRSVTLRITAEGSAVLAGAPSPLDDRFRAELAELQDWERTQILASLQRVAAMMHAAPHSGTGPPRGGPTRGNDRRPDGTVDLAREHDNPIAHDSCPEPYADRPHTGGRLAESAAELLTAGDHALPPEPVAPADSSTTGLPPSTDIRAADACPAGDRIENNDDLTKRAPGGNAVIEHDS